MPAVLNELLLRSAALLGAILVGRRSLHRSMHACIELLAPGMAQSGMRAAH